METCTKLLSNILLSFLYVDPAEGKYSSIAQVLREVVKEEGVAGLFSGIRPAMIRAFPANAACFLGMEVSRSALSFLD